MDLLRRLAAGIARHPLVPAVCFVLAPVLLLRGAFVPLTDDAAPYWGHRIAGDIRSWWKAVCVCGIALWMAATALCAVASGHRPRQFPALAVLLALAGAATLVSTLASPYSQTSWLGFTFHYEGALVLLAYLVAVWYVAVLTPGRAAAVWLLRALGLAALINAAAGATAGFGRNLWETELGYWLMGVSGLPVTHNFAGSRMASGTVFQPNHYGMLMTTLGCLALGMLFVERRGWRAAWGVVLAGSAAGVLFSQSRAAVLVFAFVAAVFLGRKAWTLRRQGRLRLRARHLAPAAVAAALLLAVPAVRQALVRVAQRTTQLSFDYQKDYVVKAVGLHDNRIALRLAGGTYHLARRDTDAWVLFQEGDAVGTAITPGKGKGEWRRAALPGTGGVRLSWRPQGNVLLTAPHTEMAFFAVGARLYAVETYGRLVPELAMSDYVPNGWEGLFSGRGYIWRRTLETWRRHPWFGTGPGTFIMAFPNQDILNKNRFTQREDEDKGHGIWASFLVQLGLIGCILYSLPVAWILVNAMRRQGALPAALLAGMAAYLLASLTNDSTVGVTPVFCVLAGLAASCEGENPECG